jgi:hypothetical protein
LFHALTEPLYVEVISFSKDPFIQAEETTLAETRSRLEKMADALRAENLKVTTAAAWD